MSTANIVALVGVIVAGLGVVVTGVFSWFVYKATKETAKATVTAADMAKASHELNTLINKQRIESEKEFVQTMRYHLKKELIKKAKSIIRAIGSMDGLEIHANLSELDLELGLSPEEVAKYFSHEEAKQIMETWQSVEYYLSNYFNKGSLDKEIGLLVTHHGIAYLPLFEMINKLERSS